MSHKPLETTVTDPLAYPEICVRSDERMRNLAREQQGLSPTPVDVQEQNVRTRLDPLMRALEGAGR